MFHRIKGNRVSILSHRKAMLTLAIVLAALLLFVALEINRASAFRVVGVEPAISSITVITPKIDVLTSENLSNGLVVRSIPGAISSYGINGNRITINFNLPMNPSQKYRLTISNVHSVTGQTMKNQTLFFNPHIVPVSQLTQNELNVQQNNQKQYNDSVYGNSLLQVLPFTGPNFEYEISYKVDYSQQNKPQLVIQIISPTPAGQSDAMDWLTSLGYDASKLNIQIIPSQP